MFDLGDEKYSGENTKAYTPLNAGANIPAVLQSVTVDDERGDLIFTFKGTDKGDIENGKPSNLGTMSHRFWANNFDSTHEYYNEVWATRYLDQIKHILKAFLPIEKTNVTGSNWLEFASNLVATLNESVYKDVPVLIKAVYDNKNRLGLPTFPDFISSALMPKQLRLDTRINPKSGQPYDKIVPVEAPVAQTGGGSFGDVAANADSGPTPSFGG